MLRTSRDHCPLDAASPCLGLNDCAAADDAARSALRTPGTRTGARGARDKLLGVHLSRSRGDDAAAAARRSKRCCRCSPSTTATHHRSIGTGGARARRSTRRTSGAALDASRARSSSPAAAPSRSTWRSRASPARQGARQPPRHQRGRAPRRAARLRHLEEFGFEVIYPAGRPLRPRRSGPADAAITDRTILVSLMLANNEVGTIEPVADLVRRVRAHPGERIHVDAVQAAPYLALDVRELGVDLLSLAATSSRGPRAPARSMSAAARSCSRSIKGGSQERYRRAGTENVAGAVGMATAYELGVAGAVGHGATRRALRDRLHSPCSTCPNVELTGHPRKRLPGHLVVVARDVDGGRSSRTSIWPGSRASTGRRALRARRSRRTS